jgi:5-methylthioadenosine/S-adenosylhomocysteine deaminase
LPWHGVDGEASTDLADPFENMRTGLYAIRDKHEDATIMSPYQVLYLPTMGSADGRCRQNAHRLLTRWC